MTLLLTNPFRSNLGSTIRKKKKKIKNRAIQLIKDRREETKKSKKSSLPKRRYSRRLQATQTPMLNFLRKGPSNLRIMMTELQTSFKHRQDDQIILVPFVKPCLPEQPFGLYSQDEIRRRQFHPIVVDLPRQRRGKIEQLIPG